MTVRNNAKRNSEWIPKGCYTVSQSEMLPQRKQRFYIYVIIKANLVLDAWPGNKIPVGPVLIFFRRF